MPRILAFFAHPPTLAPLAQVAQVVSSPRPAYTQEKREGQSRRHDAAPQEVVLRSRFDSVIQTETDAVDVSPHPSLLFTLTYVQSSTPSLPSFLWFISNSQTFA